MTALTERKIAIVRRLVETAPDRVVGSLQKALAETGDDSALGGVRRLVEAEVADRHLRNAILQPIANLCGPVRNGASQLVFPASVLSHLWRALNLTQAGVLASARRASDEVAALPVTHGLYDSLTAAAADGVRLRLTPEYAAAAEACDRMQPEGAALLASCLDLAPVVRRATCKLAEWIAHPGGETSAAARLAYRDAVEIAEDAGPRFFQMLAAQMAHPWMVLRVISAVMDKPTERYLADSELAGFGEGVMDEIDAALVSIAALRNESGPGSGRSAARLVELVVQQILELETCVDLNKDFGWGHRVQKQRTSLAGVVEGRLREAEKAAMEALPMHASRQHRVRRQIPRLNQLPEARLVGQARTLLSFCDELRTAANYGGFAATRAKLVENLSEYLIHYVEEVLDLVRAAEVEDPEIAAAFLDLAAEFSQLVSGEKAADLVRRRAHAVFCPDSHSEAQAS